MDDAADGAEGLAAALQGGYAAILTDGQMPVMTGWDMTREIRRREREPLCPPPPPAGGGGGWSGGTLGVRVAAAVVIVGVTGMAGADDACAFREAGMTDVLSKPIDRAALASVIRRWIGDGDAAPARCVSYAAGRRPGPASNQRTGTEPDPVAQATGKARGRSKVQESGGGDGAATSVSTGSGSFVRHVLVAGAGATQRVVIRAMLASYRAGCVVEAVFVPDGAAARRALEAAAAGAPAQGFDAVVLELGLAGLGSVSAAAVAAAARDVARAAGRRCPVLVGLEGGRNGPAAVAAADGFDSVLERPLRAEAFHKALRRRLATGLQRCQCVCDRLLRRESGGGGRSR